MKLEDAITSLKEDYIVKDETYIFYEKAPVLYPITCPGMFELRPEFATICSLPYLMLDKCKFHMAREIDINEDINNSIREHGLEDKDGLVILYKKDVDKILGKH